MATVSEQRDKIRMASPSQHLSLGISRALLSGDHADVLVSCNGREWKAHKIVLAAQSSFFNTALRDQPKARENRISLDAEETNVVDALMRYFYTFDYETEPEIESGSVPILASRVVIDIRMYAVGENYSIPPLQALAFKKFGDRAGKIQRSSDFARAGAEVLAYVPTGDMKEKITRALEQRLTDLLSKPDGNQALFEAFRKISELGPDIAFASSRGPSDCNEAYRCPDCKHVFTIYNPQEDEKFACPRMQCAAWRKKTEWVGCRV